MPATLTAPTDARLAADLARLSALCDTVTELADSLAWRVTCDRLDLVDVLEDLRAATATAAERLA